MHNDLHVAILAAGQSQRLGRPKQLVELEGEPLIRRQCRIALESGVGSVAVVLGCHAQSCAAAVNDLALTVRFNNNWRDGIASSIREATESAINLNANALLILHVDQYRITAQDLQTLHATWSASTISAACVSEHGDYEGPPAILAGSLFSALLELGGDAGARRVWSLLGTTSVLRVPIPNARHDLDVPSQLEGARHCR